MSTKTTLLHLGLGIVGGCIAFLAIDALTSREHQNTPTFEVLSPAAVRPAALTANAAAPAPGSIDLRDAAKKTVPAVVHVKTVQMGEAYVGNPLLDFFYGNAPRTREVPRRVGSGSGVIISADGYIITNNHVIEGSDHITVALNNKKEYDAQLIGTDPNTDIALLKIEASDSPTSSTPTPTTSSSANGYLPSATPTTSPPPSPPASSAPRPVNSASTPGP